VSTFAPLSETSPPKGYEWIHDTWKIDTKYTQTDYDGWSYAIDWNWLMNNFKGGNSCVSSIGRQVRRRRWVRKACKITDSDVSVKDSDVINTYEETKDDSAIEIDRDISIDIDRDIDRVSTRPIVSVNSDMMLLKSMASNFENDNIIDNGDDNDTNNDDNTISNTNNTNKNDETSETKDQCIEIVIFENQRRKLNTDYSSNYLLSSDRSNYSNEIGNIESDFEPNSKCESPNGYEWMDEWILDLVYTYCDANGWSYANDFGFLMSNYRKGLSQTRTDNFRFVRRRKWIRHLKRIPLSETELRKRGIYLIIYLSN
jgi:hypothetical protein